MVQNKTFFKKELYVTLGRLTVANNINFNIKRYS